MSYLSTPAPRIDHHARPLAMQAVAPGPLPSAAAMPRPQVGAELLAGLPLLCDLEPEIRQHIAQRAVVRRVARHAMVLEQGSRECGLYILLKGQAQVLRQNQRGRALVVDQLRPGDHFGELSAIDDQPQYASVRCTVPSEVLVIGRTDFIDCLHESQTLLPALLPALLQLMVQRVRRKNRRITLLALHDVRGCVVQQLLDLAELQDGLPVVRGRICRQAIADMIGASRAMVSRVMMGLTRAGELQTLPDGSTLVRCEAGGPVRRQPRRRPADGGTGNSSDSTTPG
ncbi:MAG: Crp/Fnr family transcriptional regulator [Pseudomonadota bacterium]